MVFKDQNIDKVFAREIVLYTMNHPDIHRQMTSMVLKALARRKINGTYNHEMALKAWINVIEEGIRKYSRSFGKVTLNPITREYAGKDLQIVMKDDLEEIVAQMRALKKAGKPWSMIHR